MIDHDRLFKERLTTFFTDFVDLLLPELSAYLDPDSLVFLDKEVFTGRISVSCTGIRSGMGSARAFACLRPRRAVGTLARPRA